MATKIVKPAAGERYGVSVQSRWLIVNEEQPESRTIHIAAGDLSSGAATFCIHLAEGDYCKEIKAAIVDAAARVNRKWGIG